MDDEEKLIVVLELRNYETETEELRKLATSIRKKISSEHGLIPAAIMIVKRGKVYKTTSGKISRSRVKKDYESGSLDQEAVMTVTNKSLVEEDKNGICLDQR